MNDKKAVIFRSNVCRKIFGDAEGATETRALLTVALASISAVATVSTRSYLVNETLKAAKGTEYTNAEEHPLMVMARGIQPDLDLAVTAFEGVLQTLRDNSDLRSHVTKMAKDMILEDMTQITQVHMNPNLREQVEAHCDDFVKKHSHKQAV